jgi:hypothetical protein
MLIWNKVMTIYFQDDSQPSTQQGTPTGRKT